MSHHRFERPLTFLRSNAWQCLLIVLLPILANAPALFGIFKCDPELMHSGLDVGLGGYVFPGAACYVDPDVAYITQPLGYLSAQNWLHGFLPWWNPFSGIGMPLAGEMQTQSFFLPFILLMQFHDGWLLQRIILQILTGYFTYLFLRENKLSKQAACLAGVLFSLNGAFILTPHAVIGPIFCLPVMLLGVECISQAARQGRPFGWCLFAAGLALSVYAGFPEIAFYDGILVFGWAILKGLQTPTDLRFSFAGKIILGGLVGLCMTAPLSNAFVQYLLNGSIGGHGGAFAHDILHAMAAPVQMFPLIYGSLARFPPPNLSDHGLWITVGGWFGSIPVLLALVGCFHNRGTQAGKYFFLAWVIVFEARYFGVYGVATLLNLVPGVAVTDLLRFSPVSVSFAVFALAADGFDHLQKHPLLAPRRAWWIFGSYSLLSILSIFPVLHILPEWFSGYPKLMIPAIVFFALVCLGNGLVILSITRRKFLSLVPVLAIAGSVGIFLLSQTPAPRHGHISYDGVHFLQNRQDFQRSYTLGPLGPNYAAQYGIAQINYQQLPAPKLWTDFILNVLFPDADILAFGGIQNNQAEEFLSHATTFEAIGVKYLITFSGQKIFNDHANDPLSDPWVGYLPVTNDRPVGTILPSTILRPTLISSVSIVIGTYYNRSTLPLYVQLCADATCEEASAPLQNAVDNQALMIKLGHPLQLSAGTSLSVHFIHPAGYDVAIWLPTGLTPSDYILQPLPDGSSRLVMNKSSYLPSLPMIYHDQIMDIYQLPNPAPYVEAGRKQCTVQIFSRQKFNTDCPQATTLVRRELFYPGWRAQVNNVTVPITRTEDIFQKITLPAGPAKIRFTYMPPYTPLACAAAIAAAFYWLAAGLLSRRHTAKV